MNVLSLLTVAVSCVLCILDLIEFILKICTVDCMPIIFNKTVYKYI